MTLSNFDWTDKDSVKWFILGPLGHIGPYSLSQLEDLLKIKKLTEDVKVWAEGLPDGVELKLALRSSHVAPEAEETPPELPPLPTEELPPIPENPASEVVDDSTPPDMDFPLEEAGSGKKIPAWAFIAFVVMLMGIFTLNGFISNQETLSITRQPKMSMDLYERIQKDNPFISWDKAIFFKEYLTDDHSHIWLVTSSFHTCDVAARFTSLDGKVLSMEEEKISFKTAGKLSNHIVEFSSLDFSQGNKIIPGLYEMDVKATNCEWNGMMAKLMNKFMGPPAEYVARTKVVLFSKGAQEFNTVLDKLLQKKMEIELRQQNESDLFWQDLQQKLETLQAITLQIEQHVLDFLQNDPGKFKQNVKPMVNEYTRKYGSFLTSFVIENENYFKDLKYEGKGSSQKKSYELMVKLTSKKIGLESMKFIEEFQGIKKNPGPSEIKLIQSRVKNIFSSIKSEIGQKIIQVSEDRSK